MHVLNLVAQGFRQLAIPERAAVADDMLGLLEETGIEVWVDDEPPVLFTSVLPDVFGRPESAYPSEEQEAAMVRKQDMPHLCPLCLVRSYALRGDLIRLLCVSWCNTGACGRGRGAGAGGAARSRTNVIGCTCFT
jgi:hypothetical protein